MPAIPENLHKVLNPLTLMALRNVETSGWKLHFVRRFGLEVPVPVIQGADGTTIGVLGDDGDLDLEPEIVIRNNKLDDMEPAS